MLYIAFLGIVNRMEREMLGCCAYAHMYMYIYIYVCVYVDTHIYIYIYTDVTKAKHGDANCNQQDW